MVILLIGRLGGLLHQGFPRQRSKTLRVCANSRQAFCLRIVVQIWNLIANLETVLSLSFLVLRHYLKIRRFQSEKEQALMFVLCHHPGGACFVTLVLDELPLGTNHL